MKAVHFLPSVGIEVEKEDAAEGTTSADTEIKNDAPSSPGHDRKEVTEAATSSIAVVNDGNTSSADVTVESDGETLKKYSILLLFLKPARYAGIECPTLHESRLLAPSGREGRVHG